MKATEALLANEGAAFCPNPKCGNAFFLETQTNPQEAQTILCPNCNVSSGFKMKRIVEFYLIVKLKYLLFQNLQSFL